MTSPAPSHLRTARAAGAGLLAGWLVMWVGTTATPSAAAQSVRPPEAATDDDGVSLLATIKALTASGMDGRGVGTEGGARARAWISDQLTAMKARPLHRGGFDRPFSYAPRAGATVHGVNLVAVCEGRSRAAGIIAVTAHYDHLGVRDGRTYHGADDNASGVAMLLRVTEQCVTAPLAHTLVLAFLDGEESGLQGARAFLADGAVAKERIVLDVNFDMVSRSATREIYVAGPARWPKLLPMLTAPATRASVVVKFGHDTGGGRDDWTQQSDHGVFHTAGIPFVYFGVEGHADYHKPTDTVDKIAPAFLGGVAAFILDSLEALDRASAFK